MKIKKKNDKANKRHIPHRQNTLILLKNGDLTKMSDHNAQAEDYCISIIFIFLPLRMFYQKLSTS
jgi:hypothetical protein